MRRKAGPLLAAAFLVAGAAGVKGQGPAVEPGVSAALAEWRSSRVELITYTLHFTVPAGRDSAVRTEEEIDFDLRDNSAPLQLDFRKGSSDLAVLEVNGKRTGLEYASEHILVQPALLRKGSNRISLQFMSTSQPLNRNADFLYTLLVPDRARSLFPCLDQPDRKACYHLSLTIPVGWTALANGPLKEVVQKGEVQTCYFLPSDTISTYLFAFAAGRFMQAAATEDRREMHFYYRETDSSKIRLSLEPVFRIQADALAFLQQYTGIAYPFQKFDFVAIPDFQFGGMEHPGAIQYKASSLFLDQGATREQYLSRANLLSHETAHMWFGDLVTMRWFNDVWMKEVFANFMADKVGNITMPDGLYDLKFLTSHYPAAYSIDRTGGAHAIRQRLDNLQEAGALYGNIIYHKAPLMMRQLELLMGAEAFRDGLREYLRTYAGGNASWPDLIGIMGRYTAADLESWNKVWVNEAGRPVFGYRLEADGDRIGRLTISQRGEDGSARVWPQIFSISLVYADHREELRINMDRAAIVVDTAKGRPLPQYVLFNTDGLGYGVFPVDGRALAGIMDGGGAVARASMYINLYEHMLNGDVIGPRKLLDLYRGLLPKETEELNLNLLTDQMSSVYWRWLGGAERDQLAPDLEKDLWAAMQGRQKVNERKTLFKVYAGIAMSREGQDRLYAIWKSQQAPEGVTLTEEDYTGLAAGLALRGYPAQKEILQTQGERIKNRDRRERWEYLLPALSADEAKRDAFFASLLRPEGRRKETWVLTGLSYLHHPLRVGVSVKYLPATLALLEEVQRTGDVFFPQGWLQASLGWYRSPAAAAMVRDFLAAHPGYNEKLRAKILQSADNLFRAAK